MVQTIKNLKSYLEIMQDSLRDFQKEHPNQPFTAQLTLQLAPGLLTDSEALSYLDKISRALGQFNEAEAANLDLKLTLVNALDEAWSGTVEKRAGLAEKLRQNAADAKASIIVPGA